MRAIERDGEPHPTPSYPVTPSLGTAGKECSSAKCPGVKVTVTRSALLWSRYIIHHYMAVDHQGCSLEQRGGAGLRQGQWAPPFLLPRVVREGDGDRKRGREKERERSVRTLAFDSKQEGKVRLSWEVTLRQGDRG